MTTDILLRLIDNDPALAGFASDDLPDAAKARIQNTLCSLERHFDDEEIALIERWTGGNAIFDAAAARFDGPAGCSYYLFADRSLYFRSNGDSEVWSLAADFADERIINGYDGALDEMDARLLAHLGGFRAEIAADRGTR